jgi:hypothetical protein
MGLFEIGVGRSFGDMQFCLVLHQLTIVSWQIVVCIIKWAYKELCFFIYHNVQCPNKYL